jgi:hypothetical protein
MIYLSFLLPLKYHLFILKKPSAPDLDIFSEPAKSIIFSIPFFMESSLKIYFISIIKRVWALLD